MARLALLVAAGASVVAASPLVRAQPAQEGALEGERAPSYLQAPVRAPRSALEIGVSGGYTQPIGTIRRGLPIGHVVDAGVGAGVDVGYRISPHFSLGANLQYHESNPDDRLGAGASVRGGAAGIEGSYHLAPYQRIDPYVTLGTGYRLLWRNGAGAGDDVLTHGFEIARAQVGVDLRVSKDVAIGPALGADVDMFVWDNPEDSRGNVSIDARRVSSFVFAGIAGRFDVGGTREWSLPMAAYQPASSAGYFQSSVETTPPVQARNAGTTGVRIDPEILRACGINGPAAYFAFDSADVRSDGTSALERVARCVSDGALRGRSIEIVGHTDPRGSAAYNERLGEARADSVAAYLARRGVQQYRVFTASRGERDAVGSDPRTWAYDRRVDIILVK